MRTSIVSTTSCFGSLRIVSTQRRPTTVPSPKSALAQFSSESGPVLELIKGQS